jgi:hypothetical protein
MPNLIVVKATHDEEAGVWITESADLPGLRLEGDDVAIEVIAHASTRVHFARAS